MSCFECGNCRQEGSTYYCTAKDEFMIREQTSVLEKTERNGWKKGDSHYENRRRNRKDGEIQKIG